MNGRLEPLGVVGMDLGDVAASSIKSAPTQELILCHVVPISDRASTGDDQWEAKKHNSQMQTQLLFKLLGQLMAATSKLPGKHSAPKFQIPDMKLNYYAG